VKRLVLGISVFAALVIVVGLPAAGHKDIDSRCLELTRRTALRTAPIVAGLGLTPGQVREARSRLSAYYGARGFDGLNGIGLNTRQLATINRRIAFQVAGNSHPLGWPCAPFKNPSRLLKFLKADLAADGIGPPFRVISISPMQIQLEAGDWRPVVVLRLGPRLILVRLFYWRNGRLRPGDFLEPTRFEP
jgi:hypothetical protein